MANTGATAAAGAAVAPQALPPMAYHLVEDTSALVSPPEVCLRLIELVRSPDSSMGQIGELIARDPNLTARLLRLVNSAFYGFRGRIDTVSRAVTIIGLQELSGLVLAISAVRSFSKVPNCLVNMDTFWRHGIYTGLVARTLARHCHVLHPERLFVAGLLHDIGSLVLYHRLPEIVRHLLLVAQGDEEILHAAEREEFGFTHAELGALLLEQWHIPGALREAVRCHHEPGAAGTARLETAIVHVANVLANRSNIGGYCEQTRDGGRIDPEALALAGIREDAFSAEAVMNEVGEQFSQTAAVLAA